MHNSKTLFEDFVKRITLTEDKEEILSIGYIVFEDFLEISRTDILAAKKIELSPADLDRLSKIADRINTHEPIQYILGEADFFGRKFKVDSSVLIPRPETEELVRLIITYSKSLLEKTEIKILDIGTGSGCIPITLALEMPDAEIYATDISENALAIATQNAESLRTSVHFSKHDILNENFYFKDLDFIVSNPPYITLAEKDQMNKNVTSFESHLALFVPQDDPLIFYKVIAKKAITALKNGGLLCVEINEKFGKEVAQLFSENGFREVAVIKDLQGKDRIVKGIKENFLIKEVAI